MENEEITPASTLNDAEYKDFIVQNFGHIRGLAKTLLQMHKSARKSAEGSSKTSPVRDDIANYHEARIAVDQARKALNRLHIRLMYAEKDRSFADIPYEEIDEIAKDVCSGLNDMRQKYVEPRLDSQKDELMIDYVCY